ncbi:septum formation family protein [Actinophytocola glycyrrhizae]|uniref:Septum formation family protein n=1 Tax=Actinophytocola glycyrrhizae TaxID=2044873 RepID=A0ABV9S4F0_9PSEU
MFRRVVPFLVAVPLAACVSTVGGKSAAAPVPTAPTTTTTTTGPPPDGAYPPGDCLAIEDGIQVVSCEEPHEYEVTLSDELPAGVPDTFPPELATVVGPTCRETLVEFTGSTDVEASLVEAAYVWPTEPRWRAGQRWYSCLASVDSANGETTRRTGSLRDVLADGLGDLRQCLVGGPADPGPAIMVSCDQPHRSEAVTPVVKLGELSGPPPTRADIEAVTTGECRAAVEEYLGGERDGVGFGMSYGSPEQWPAGYNTGTCMAISDAPVTGLMGPA